MRIIVKKFRKVRNILWSIGNLRFMAFSDDTWLLGVEVVLLENCWESKCVFLDP